MNPYEPIEEPPKPKVVLVMDRLSAKLYITLLAHRVTYLVFAILGIFFYWRSDATSLGEIFGWVGVIGYCVDIIASSIAEALLGKDNA